MTGQLVSKSIEYDTLIVEQHPHGGRWLREIVFGLNDGLVTTLVFVIAVSAVAHAQLIIVAFGELFAGGVSMGLGGYLSARTARDVTDQRIETERLEISQEPDEERAELEAIYRRKGIDGPLLDLVVEHITSDEDRWLAAMVREELGVVEESADLAPWLQGCLVGGSFMLGALVPIVPFLILLPIPQLWAYLAAVTAALILGLVKSRYTLKSAFRNGAELLLIVTAGTLAGVAIRVLLPRV